MMTVPAPPRTGTYQNPRHCYTGYTYPAYPVYQYG